MLNQRGSSLLEWLCALWLLSLLVVCSQRFIVRLILQQQQWLYRYQLQYHLAFIADHIAQSLRRTGYCPSIHPCHIAALRIGQLAGEAVGSCLMMTQRISNGKLVTTGYRLHQGNIETQHNITDCQSGGWERLLPDKTVIIEHFVLHQLHSQQYQLVLAGHWQNQPRLRYHFTRFIQAYNL